ncbi:MAG: hypothetical protein ABEL76_08025 [Bradymonadaceae bacterium]
MDTLVLLIAVPLLLYPVWMGVRFVMLRQMGGEIDRAWAAFADRSGLELDAYDSEPDHEFGYVVGLDAGPDLDRQLYERLEREFLHVKKRHLSGSFRATQLDVVTREPLQRQATLFGVQICTALSTELEDDAFDALQIVSDFRTEVLLNSDPSAERIPTDGEQLDDQFEIVLGSDAAAEERARAFVANSTVQRCFNQLESYAEEHAEPTVLGDLMTPFGAALKEGELTVVTGPLTDPDDLEEGCRLLSECREKLVSAAQSEEPSRDAASGDASNVTASSEPSDEEFDGVEW